MKKILLMAGLSCVIVLAACNGSDTHASGTDSARADSMINEATAAVSAAADSVGSKVDSTLRAAADSLKTAADTSLP